MLNRTFRLLDRAAFHRKHDVPFRLSTQADDGRPIDDTVAAGAADRRAGDLAAFGLRLLNQNIFGVQMDQVAEHPFEPGERIVPAQITVSGVEVDPDGRAASSPGEYRES